MNAIVKPTSYLKGKIQLPGSKSYSIRAFMIAHCAPQASIISPSNCEDAQVAMRVIRQLGSTIKTSSLNTFSIRNIKTKFNPSLINVGESGTVLRLLLPLVSSVHENLLIKGEGTLKGRPNKHLIAALRKMGKDIKGTGQKGSVPIKIGKGNLRPGIITIDGSLSSQFVSALLMTCPRLKENSTLILKGKKLVSSDYVTMTQQVLSQCGIKINKKNERLYVIPGNQRFKALRNFHVPADHGLAAFLMAAACLVPSSVQLKGFLGKKFIQADGAIFGFLRKMGAKFHMTEQGIAMKGPFNLKGGVFSLKNCPDLVPIMSVLALFAKGETRLIHIAHARAKESDRISDLRKELLKIGADIRETRDALIIRPKNIYKENILLDPHHDHRLAMAFCVLGLKFGVRVKDIECTHKSYPDFTKDFKALGARIISSK